MLNYFQEPDIISRSELKMCLPIPKLAYDELTELSAEELEAYLMTYCYKKNELQRICDHFRYSYRPNDSRSTLIDRILVNRSSTKMHSLIWTHNPEQVEINFATLDRRDEDSRVQMLLKKIEELIEEFTEEEFKATISFLQTPKGQLVLDMYKNLFRTMDL